MEPLMKRIILIDEARTTHKDIYETMGVQFSLTFAKNLSEARSFLAGDHFDLILLESKLPDGNGYDFCKELKENEAFQEVPVIFLSEESSSLAKVQAFSIGADDYLVKPFDVLELAARVNARLKKGKFSRDQEF